MSDRNRWWDYYYVRYFVGAIFGAALLLWLQTHARVCTGDQCRIAPRSLPLEATALATIGLAFCYLASAPVLVLHALRFRFCKSSWLFNVLGIVVSAIVVIGAIYLWRSYGRPDSGPLNNVLSFTPFAFVLLAQVLLLWTWPADAVQTGYRELAKQRGHDETNGKEKGGYIESYRHLREHGNAYAILLAELVFSLAVRAAPTWYVVGGLIVLWVLPAAFVWFIGTWLEFGIGGV